MHLKVRAKLPSKKLEQETERERPHGSKPVHFQKDLQFIKTASTSSPDNEFGLHSVSAVLHSYSPDLSRVITTLRGGKTVGIFAVLCRIYVQTSYAGLEKYTIKRYQFPELKTYTFY